MTFKDLEALAREGENSQLEFKTSTGDLKGGMESLCGFLNAGGGIVLFGVTDAGKIVGQDVTDKTFREISSALGKLDPPCEVAQTKLDVSDTRSVIVLETIDRSFAPYTYDGKPYQRNGTTTSVMKQSEYERKLLDRGNSQRRWENLPAEDYDIASLDREEIDRTVREAVSANRLESSVSGPEDVLAKLHLTKRSRLLQAAVVAFAREVMPDYPQCGLRLARFRGITKNEFVDQRQLHGHLFLLLDEAMLFLRRHLPVSGRFEPGTTTRVDEPLFPTLALREALVNALCHRDYSIVGGAISVGLFDDRLEISSTGRLPFGLTVADLKSEHASQPRNPLIAEVLFRRGLVERWGRGIDKIRELCLQAGHPEPEFQEVGQEFVVTFRPSGYSPPMRVGHDLTDRQRRILFVLRDGARHQLSEIQDQLGIEVSLTPLKKDLRFLRELHLVDSGGSGRGSYWQLRTNTGESN